MAGLLDFIQGASNSAASTVAGPVDLLSMGLRSVGVPVGNAPFGGSQWMRNVGLMRDYQNPTAGILGESVGGVLPMVASAYAPQIAGGLLRMGENMRAPTPMNTATRGQAGAIVWHGGPYKFDPEPGAPFGRLRSSDTLGTGEGNAAFGDGLYTAANKKVAHSYATDMLAQKALNEGRISLKRGDVDLNWVYREAHSLPTSKTGFAKDFREAVKVGLLERSDRKDFMRLVDDILEAKKGGFLYKIDLPDDKIARMIDWDKPLYEQTPAIREALKDFDPNLTVADLIKQLGTNHAEKLRNLGIPGVRYLDADSRWRGTGSQNFVIFPGEEESTRVLNRIDLP